MERPWGSVGCVASLVILPPEEEGPEFVSREASTNSWSREALNAMVGVRRMVRSLTMESTLTQDISFGAEIADEHFMQESHSFG